jgi:hypothetical protein
MVSTTHVANDELSEEEEKEREDSEFEGNQLNLVRVVGQRLQYYHNSSQHKRSRQSASLCKLLKLL